MSIFPFPDPIINCNFENVYAPSDDTYLILDYFKNKIDNSYFDDIKINKIKNLLDLGTGTGIIAIFFQLIKKEIINFDPKIYASDISENAIKCVKSNMKANEIYEEINLLCSDLFNSFPDNLKNSFNIIIFNPPYLPSSRLIKKDQKKDIDYSWNGGEKGHEVLINFLEKANYFLNLQEKHYIYCITSSRTDIVETNRLITNLGYKNQIVKKTHLFFEDIYLNRLTYNRL
ncbi:MAG: methyltransferase [Promethearchaeota archaeon]|nr:MAG: methyltransferase [Candidatus Lokiarchaeota archaeon]